jgi:diaminohydroxyphosphoribosylaminopyrimidine deaminase/5-amino-6-(5-phosphoribosylamino)uracil reductase
VAGPAQVEDHACVATAVDDADYMDRAIARAATVRQVAPPNPWVGAVLVTAGGGVHEGATAAPGGPHAEIDALA